LALKILGTSDAKLLAKLDDYRAQLEIQVGVKNENLKSSL
jgi:phosphoribosylcarboxyaminoimidazole (NCAIR) mutase